MSVIVCALLYVFVSSKPVAPAPPVKPVIKVQTPKPKPVEPKVEVGIEVIEISGKNVTDAPPKRIKRLDSDESDKHPNSQSLVYFPSQSMKPPKILRRPQVINFPQFPPNHRQPATAAPRPFNHMMSMNSGLRPNGFKKPMSTARSYQVNSIQDVLNHPNHQMPQSMRHQMHHYPMSNIRFANVESSTHPIQLAGTYRHPKQKHADLLKMFGTNDQSVVYAGNEVEDPFHNYRPQSPFEINQLAMSGMHYSPTPVNHMPAFRRKSRFPVASIPNYNLHSKDVSHIYQNVLHSGQQFNVDRNERYRDKPLSMMLDVFPMGGQMPSHKRPRMKPFQGFYQDPNVFNTMQFPQLMPRYPSYFRYPQMHAEGSNKVMTGMTKPSQLVVHLNLFPKGKDTNKRSSTEEQLQRLRTMREKAQSKRNESAPVNINFNMNGHPENVNLMKEQTTPARDVYDSYGASTEPALKPPNYYYDDNSNEEGVVVPPSLVYQNIHRDRPTYLMLKNSTSLPEKTTSTTQATIVVPPRKLKTHQHTYQSIESPKKYHIKNEPKRGGIFL